ncbi:MAG: isoprenylcysteine carboxylmethyltransferase family protein [Anaerolineales bacterium]|nr:isoprenylcysteine carboxylmethyltransferase family protein [Anaerolineales bacterium]
MNEKSKIFTIRAVFLSLIFIVVIPLLPILISWRWDWWEAWVYAGIGILGFIISRALAARRNPDLLRERAKYLDHEDAESWDRLLSPLVGLGGGLIPITAGLDALLGWSPAYSLTAKIISLAALLSGYALGAYALIENAYFSGMVRIQKERGQHVISSGPYAWVRHPGYTGALLFYVATPIFLDAFWAFIPVVFLSIVIVIRTHLEDKTLQAQLEGYCDYAKRVRYRLLPGIW